MLPMIRYQFQYLMRSVNLATRRKPQGEFRCTSYHTLEYTAYHILWPSSNFLRMMFNSSYIKHKIDISLLTIVCYSFLLQKSTIIFRFHSESQVFAAWGLISFRGVPKPGVSNTPYSNHCVFNRISSALLQSLFESLTIPCRLWPNPPRPPN